MMKADKLIFFILLVLLTGNAYALPVSENYKRNVRSEFVFGCVPFVVVSFESIRSGMERQSFVLRNDEKLIQQFGRGFLNNSKGGLFEYLHCFVTNKRRIWLFSETGKIVETGPDEEIYL